MPRTIDEVAMEARILTFRDTPDAWSFLDYPPSGVLQLIQSGFGSGDAVTVRLETVRLDVPGSPHSHTFHGRLSYQPAGAGVEPGLPRVVFGLSQPDAEQLYAPNGFLRRTGDSHRYVRATFYRG